MVNLVSFIGEMGSGKTTAAKVLVRKGWVKIAFADALKLEIFDHLWCGTLPELCVDTNNLPDPTKFFRTSHYYIDRADAIRWVNDHKPTLRSILQSYGTEYRRAKDPEYWIKKWESAVRTEIMFGHKVVVDDARFNNEHDAVERSNGFAVAILANRGLRQGIPGHSSENIDYHYARASIFNSNLTLEAFEEEVEEAVTFAEMVS
jgi:hypothetical protein